MKRVFAYLRVSSKGQLEGDGFDRQRAKIQAFCDERGWIVSRWFEEAFTGTEYESREKFIEMVSLLGPGIVDTVIVEKADRLARDLMVSELAIMEVGKAGGSVFSVEAALNLNDASDPTRVLIRQFMGALAQWDKSNLVLRLRAARERKAARGERANGTEPWEDKSAFNHAIAHKLFERKNRGATIAQLVKYLHFKKISSPTGDSFWHRSTVHALLMRYKPRVVNLDALTPEQRAAVAELEELQNA